MRISVENKTNDCDQENKNERCGGQHTLSSKSNLFKRIKHKKVSSPNLDDEKKNLLW